MTHINICKRCDFWRGYHWPIKKMCGCCDNWHTYYWPLKKDVLIYTADGNFVLMSCFVPWHMGECKGLKSLLDKAMDVKVIDDVLDAFEWEDCITKVFAQMKQLEDTVPGILEDDMQRYVHERFWREFGRVLEMAAQFLYAPVEKDLRSHRGIGYRLARMDFMELTQNLQS